MIKKTISILLAVILTASCFILNVFAASPHNARVKEYLAAPSQYTNAGYGTGIENTLSGSPYTVSLGNFGGYVIYEFDSAIQNSALHRYGVDFMICGNSFNGAKTTQEPGQVWVSQDGENWYALAGSEHYENETLWNYGVTYHNTGTGVSNYSDTIGESGTVSPRSPYPKKDFYPTVDFDENELTLSGILLKKDLSGSVGSGISTSFGYVDALESKISDTPFNPYIENPAANGADGQFDISWAVDRNGFPVHLDWIKYIKVQTATFIDAGIFGEKSTEINCVNLADDESFLNAKTDIEITVNGQKAVFDGNNFCKLNNLGKGVDVKVNADDANIYINNERTNEKLFAAAPEKNLVRVIVQSGDGEPQIFILDVSSALPETELKLSHSELELTCFETKRLKANLSGVEFSSSDENVAYVNGDGKVFALSEGNATITATAPSGQTAECKVTVAPDVHIQTVSTIFSASDENIIAAPENLEVSAGIARAYGYDVAAVDHNGNPVSGVTVFDVIVAAHKQMYGDLFTVSTAENYLVMTDSFIKRVFGKSSSSVGFLVNGKMPNDGIINSALGTSTGYACDTATVSDGDEVTFFFYQDAHRYSDMCARFDCENYTVGTGKKLKINIKGYSLAEHGLESDDIIEKKYLENLSDVDIFVYRDGELQKLGKTNRFGNVKIKLGEEGEYTLVALRNSQGDEPPTVAAYAHLTVTAKKDLWIVRVFKTVINFFKSIFQSVFGEV